MERFEEKQAQDASRDDTGVPTRSAPMMRDSRAPGGPKRQGQPGASWRRGGSVALGPRGERIIEGEGVWSGGKWPERTRELGGHAGAGGGHQPDLWAGCPGGATWPRFPHAAGRSENRAGLEDALQGAPAGGAAGAGDPAAAETAGAGALAAGQWGPASGVPRVPGGRPGSVGPSEAAGLGGREARVPSSGAPPLRLFPPT